MNPIHLQKWASWREWKMNPSCPSQPGARGGTSCLPFWFPSAQGFTRWRPPWSLFGFLLNSLVERPKASEFRRISAKKLVQKMVAVVLTWKMVTPALITSSKQHSTGTKTEWRSYRWMCAKEREQRRRQWRHYRRLFFYWTLFKRAEEQQWRLFSRFLKKKSKIK